MILLNTYLKVQYLDKLISMYIIELNVTSVIEQGEVFVIINNKRIE